MNQSYKKYTDDELLGLMREHDDEKAFDALYGRYVHELIRTAVRKTGDSAAAQDLVQELFVTFWLNRQKCVIRKTLAAYLNGMLRNLIITYYHREQSRQPAALEHAIQLSDNNTREQIQFDTLNDLYEQSLQKLPEKCRKVFVLSRKGYSQKEIAQSLTISEKTVEAHIGKALRVLRVEMKDYIVFALITSTLHSIF
ncbi:RNA polymerase sigma-70 factor [Persicitalea jodogahamensis]|uniref:RNA polymerase sigma-70 factor n=1 Tax=Persicitalea jodogahamensis TaxID=402147 RepID=UPI00366C264A